MRWSLVALVMLAFAATAACGGDDDAPNASTTATSGSATASASPTPNDAETVWVRELCERDLRYAQEERAIPGIGQHAESLTLEQRRARAEILWPALAELDDRYAEEAAQIDPPARVAALHEALRLLRVSRASETRRSIAEIDLIFASVEAIDANNQRLDASEKTAYSTADSLFLDDPPILRLYESLPECDLLDPTATP